MIFQRSGFFGAIEKIKFGALVSTPGPSLQKTIMISFFPINIVQSQTKTFTTGVLAYFVTIKKLGHLNINNSFRLLITSQLLIWLSGSNIKTIFRLFLFETIKFCLSFLWIFYDRIGFEILTVEKVFFFCLPLGFLPVVGPTER